MDQPEHRLRSRTPSPSAAAPEGPPTPAPTTDGPRLRGRRLLWAVLALAMGSFAIGTTEFTIMGLLPEAVADLDVSQEAGGVLISMYALGVVVGAPTLAAALSTVDRRRSSMLLMGLFTAGHLGSLLAPSIGWMMAARFLSGLPHGAFFSAAALAAAHLAGPTRRGQAVGWVLAGLSVANLLGVPAATALGQQAGWRWMFVVVAACAGLCIMATWLLVPPVPAPEGSSIRGELTGLTSPRLWRTALVGVLGFAGMFCLYTYIAALLTDVGGLTPRHIPLVLGLYGVGMVAGTLLGGAMTDRDPVRTLRLSFLLSAVTLLLVYLLSPWWWAALLPLFLVAVCGSGIAPALQVLLVDAAPGSPQLAGSLNHSALNMANAIGAWLGAAIIGAGHAANVPSLAGAGVAALGLVLSCKLIRRQSV
ncbi:MFS transporter [Micrococcus luteus]